MPFFRQAGASTLTSPSGSAQQVFVATTGQIVNLTVGSTATPDASPNPAVKVVRTVAMPRASVTGDGGEQMAAILGITVGTAANQVQTVGVYGGALDAGTSNGGSGGVGAAATPAGPQAATTKLEVRHTTTTADLVVFGDGAVSNFFTTRYRNSNGSGFIGVSGGANDGITGSIAGDFLVYSQSGSKSLILGGSTRIIQVTAANTLGFFATAPIAQYATTGTATGFTAGGGTTVTHTSTFTGNTGATAYTIGDIVRALKLYRLMAA